MAAEAGYNHLIIFVQFTNENTAPPLTKKILLTYEVYCYNLQHTERFFCLMTVFILNFVKILNFADRGLSIMCSEHW